MREVPAEHAPGAPTDAAVRGLVNLGFRDAEARRAVELVSQRHDGARPLEDILRDALILLAPRPHAP